MPISTSIRPPSSEAKAPEIQAYLTQILQDLFAVPPKEAEAIAARWKYGRGQEFYSYKINEYKSVFGAELGHILFGIVTSLRPRKEAPTQDILMFLSLLVASFTYLIGVEALEKSGFTNRVLSQFAFAGFFFLLFFIMRGSFRS